MPSSVEIEYCPKCDYPKHACQCERVRREELESKQRAIEAEIGRLGGLRPYREFTRDRFEDKSALAKCETFPACNLYLYGPTGCGKTHLAIALIRALPKIIIAKPMDIFREMRDCESARKEAALLDRMTESYLLIDDLGVEKMTEFALQTIYEIIDMRWMNAQGGLIITSNLSLDLLAAKLGDDRITSRIAGMCRVVGLNGRDYRLEARK